MNKITTQEKEDAIKYLKSVIKPTSELIVNIASVSASGMTRKMDLFVIGKVNRREYKKDSTESKIVARYELIKLNWYLKKAGFEKLDKNNQIIVNGCGMDMVFSLTYGIKCALFGYNKGINNQQYKLI
ncbi:MAG: hypothetical protein ACRC6O_13445 [Flavobacterium sp.]